MAAVSLPTVQSVQSTLHLSTMDASFTWICPLENYFDQFEVNPYMHTIKNICRVKDKQKSEYSVEKVSQDRFEVIKRASGRETTILGCDLKLRVFYSRSKDPIRFFRMLPMFNKPLTEKENLLTDPRCRYSIELRKEIADRMQHYFHFAPPPVVCDQLTENRIQKSHPKFIPSAAESTPESLLKELVDGNQGVFLGYSHSQTEKVSTLLKKIFPLLKNFGVKHLYFELPALTLYQQFALFNGNQEGSRNILEMQELTKRLEECNVGHHKKFVEISLCAKSHGIEVWPIDLSFNNLSEVSSYAIAVTYRNEIMKKNISYYSSHLKEGEKYLILCGYRHYEIPVDLSIPNIRIHTESSNALSHFLEEKERHDGNEISQLQTQLKRELTLEERKKGEEGHDVLLIMNSSEETGFRLEFPKKDV